MFRDRGMKILQGMVLCLTLLVCFPTVAKASDLVITIAVGHGGSDSGATAYYNGRAVYEKTLNLKIAKALQKELNTYEGVKVYMTRTTDKYVALEDMVKIAKSHNSQLLIGVHNNAGGGSGANALTSYGQYFPQLGACTDDIGKLILSELHTKTGVANRGFLKRYHASLNYPNGKRADYYVVIHEGIKAGIPSMYIEHAYMDNWSDYSKYLSSDAKLVTLGQADATGIAKYYGLTKKDGSVSYKKQGLPVQMISRHTMLKGGNYYYVMDNNKYYKGWKKINNALYYFTPSGKAATGLKQVDITTRQGLFYFNKMGKALTGWRSIHSHWYYFRTTSGKAWVNCTRTIDGVSYTFDENGICTNR